MTIYANWMKGDEEILYYEMINNTLKQNKNMIKLKKKKMKEKTQKTTTIIYQNKQIKYNFS